MNMPTILPLILDPNNPGAKMEDFDAIIQLKLILKHGIQLPGQTSLIVSNFMEPLHNQV